MYVIGDEAEDEQKVLGKINEKLEEKINATLTVKHMSLSDYAQKYSLTIASGEAIDIIYASSWAGYTTEATKGAFAEVSDEVLEKYMPLTKENEPEIAFEQAQVGGKAYFVPANNAAVIGNKMCIRDRLRTAKNGYAGLELSRKFKPDIVLTDVRMPCMDGVEMAFAIRRELLDCCIIFMSGYSDKEYLKSAIALKAIKMCIRDRVCEAFLLDHQIRFYDFQLFPQRSQVVPFNAVSKNLGKCTCNQNNLISHAFCSHTADHGKRIVKKVRINLASQKCNFCFAVVGFQFIHSGIGIKNRCV